MSTCKRIRAARLRWLAGGVLALAGFAWLVPAMSKAPDRPNILFFVLDDVGIDQMKAFGYGGATPPRRARARTSR